MSFIIQYVQHLPGNGSRNVYVHMQGDIIGDSDPGLLIHALY